MRGREDKKREDEADTVRGQIGNEKIRERGKTRKGKSKRWRGKRGYGRGGQHTHIYT